jgi:REP element-mobilizing transposase RayT
MNSVEYTSLGKIAETQLLSLRERYPYVTIDCYVIMPNHIHAILILDHEAAGASPRPTVMDIICAYKSLTTRECRKSGFSGILFQTSFYEHIIRGREDYEETVKYICENPGRWYDDELYTQQ